MSTSLFELTGRFVELSRMVEESPDGEIDAALDAFLSDTEGQIEDKVDSYVGLIDELEAVADARNAEAKRLADLARMDSNNAARLRERLRKFGALQSAWHAATLEQAEAIVAKKLKASKARVLRLAAKA